MHVWKGQALGNDYLVVESATPPSTALIRALCDRHRGIGSDGILVGDTAADPVRLRIFNPDGTEAEKSGNGLRIFGAWLHHRGLVGDDPFPVALPGETVEMVVESMDDGVPILRVALGTASFRAGDVHFTDADPGDEVMGRPVPVTPDGAPGTPGGATVELPIHLVSMGNPHCVVLLDELDDDAFRRLAPALQRDPAFAEGVNIQFARVVGPGTLEIRIWERGAGETLASGSSASAATAAALRVGRLAERDVEVRMPGGSVRVQVADDWAVTLTGPAQMVFEGEWLGDA